MKKREPENADVMKKYFADLKTFMQKAGAQLWIQHDLAHHLTLNKAPAFYE